MVNDKYTARVTTIVAFCNCYLWRHFENLQGVNKILTRLEVFLDEFYYHLYHIIGRIWASNYRVVYSPAESDYKNFVIDEIDD